MKISCVPAFVDKSDDRWLDIFTWNVSACDQAANRGTDQSGCPGRLSTTSPIRLTLGGLGCIKKQAPYQAKR
ncbi:hypothetical protein N7501_011308 [Penicillium viridicatum]|nr:hypothetical protein N7501_011308 [Penicillium viridicatum]